MFAQIINHLPYPVAVFSSDGTMNAANIALLTEMSIKRDDVIVGRYNVYGCEDAEVSEAVQKAFSGETVYLNDVKFPFRISKSKENPLHNFDAIVFPADEQSKKILNIVIMLLGHETQFEGDLINQNI